MLNRAPSVYVPVPPEDNGLVTPFLLSLVVHGLAIGFIVISHNIPSLHTPSPIETSLVTPEELAALQQQVIENREAQHSDTQSGALSQLTGQGYAGSVGDDNLNPSNTPSDSIISDSTSNTTSNEVVAAQPSMVERLKNRVPVFRRSDAPPDPIDAPSSSNNAPTNRPTIEDNASKKTIKPTPPSPVAKNPTNQSNKSVEKSTAKPKPNPEVEKLQQQRLSNSEAARRFNEQIFEEDFEKEFDEIETDIETSNTTDNKTASSQNSQPLTNKKSNSADNGKSPSKSSGQAGGGSSGGSKSAEKKKVTNTLSKGQITHAAFQQISQQWRKPVDIYDTSITMRIPVDTTTGAVKMAQVRRIAGDAALEPSIKAAIRAAGPLKSVIGADYNSLDLEFVINPK